MLKTFLLLLVTPVALVRGHIYDHKNVLMIIADDMRTSLGAYPKAHPADPIMDTPNLDQLASESMVLENAYVQIPMSYPSRASMMTSRLPDTIKVYDQVTNFRKSCGQIKTMPEFFKDHGYTSIGIGKVFHQGGFTEDMDDIQSWSEPVHRPQDEWGYSSGHKLSQQSVPQQFRQMHPLRDDLIVREAVSTIQQLASKQPFFLAVGYEKPDIPFECPEEFFNLYPRSSIQTPNNEYIPKDFPEVAWEKCEAFDRFQDLAELGYSGAINSTLAKEVVIDLRRAYFACVSYIDRWVGVILDTLKSPDLIGLDRNTIVVFVSDNGYLLGEHGQWCERYNYELTTHAPMMIKIPGLTDGGRHVPQLVEFVDLFPTIAEAAGLESLDECPDSSCDTALCTDGRSLLPLLYGNFLPTTWREGACSQVTRIRNGKPIMGYSVRSQHFRFNVYVDDREYSPIFNNEMGEELYLHYGLDQGFDPDENENQATNAAFSSEVAHHKMLVNQLCRKPFPPQSFETPLSPLYAYPKRQESMPAGSPSVPIQGSNPLGGPNPQGSTNPQSPSNPQGTSNSQPFFPGVADPQQLPNNGQNNPNLAPGDRTSTVINNHPQSSPGVSQGQDPQQFDGADSDFGPVWPGAHPPSSGDRTSTVINNFPQNPSNSPSTGQGFDRRYPNTNPEPPRLQPPQAGDSTNTAINNYPPENDGPGPGQPPQEFDGARPDAGRGWPSQWPSQSGDETDTTINNYPHSHDGSNPGIHHDQYPQEFDGRNPGWPTGYPPQSGDRSDTVVNNYPQTGNDPDFSPDQGGQPLEETEPDFGPQWPIGPSPPSDDSPNAAIDPDIAPDNGDATALQGDLPSEEPTRQQPPTNNGGAIPPPKQDEMTPTTRTGEDKPPNIQPPSERDANPGLKQPTNKAANPGKNKQGQPPNNKKPEAPPDNNKSHPPAKDKQKTPKDKQKTPKVKQTPPKDVKDKNNPPKDEKTPPDSNKNKSPAKDKQTPPKDNQNPHKDKKAPANKNKSPKDKKAPRDAKDPKQKTPKERNTTKNIENNRHIVRENHRFRNNTRININIRENKKKDPPKIPKEKNVRLTEEERRANRQQRRQKEGKPTPQTKGQNKKNKKKTG